jgi:hypothetical protein
MNEVKELRLAAVREAERELEKAITTEEKHYARLQLERVKRNAKEWLTAPNS